MIPSRYLRLSGMVHVHLECTVLWACKSACHVISRRPVTWLILISKTLYHWSIRRVLKGAHIDQEILWIKPTKYQQKFRYFLNLNQKYLLISLGQTGSPNDLSLSSTGCLNYHKMLQNCCDIHAPAVTAPPKGVKWYIWVVRNTF